VSDIFPGSRSPFRELGSFTDGEFYVALESYTTVIPPLFVFAKFTIIVIIDRCGYCCQETLRQHASSFTKYGSSLREI